MARAPKMKKLLFAFLVLAAVLVVGCSQQQPQSTVTVTKISGPENQTAAPATIACTKDSDCGNKTTLSAYCFQGNPSGKVRVYKCLNPNTTSASCTFDDENAILDTCTQAQFCKNGACVNFTNCTNSNNGDIHVYGIVRTSDGASYEDYCSAPNKLVEYYCGPDNQALYKIYACICDGGQCSS